MSDKHPNTERSEKPLQPNAVSPGFAGWGKQTLDRLGATQAELLESFQALSQSRFERMQSQATLASDLGAKLTAARSIPEATAAYQEWGRRQMEMASEDAKELFANGQKLLESGTRVFSNGWRSGGPGAST